MPARCTLEQPCSVPLSRFTLSPSLAADVAPTPSFCLFLPPLPPSVSSVHYSLSLFRSLGRLLFSVSLVDDSPFDPLCDNGTSRSLGLSLSLLLASLSSIVGLRAPCAFVLVAPSDRRWFSVFFFHQVPPAPFSFPLTVPSLPRAERQKGRGRNRSLSSPFLPLSVRRSAFSTLCSPLIYPRPFPSLSPRYRLPLSATSSPSFSPVRQLSVSSLLVSRHPAFLSFALRPP